MLVAAGKLEVVTEMIVVMMVAGVAGVDSRKEPLLLEHLHYSCLSSGLEDLLDDSC